MPALKFNRAAFGVSIIAALVSLQGSLHAASIVAAGEEFATSVAITDGSTSGTLRSWGKNDVGQLGQGNTNTPQPVPTPVTLAANFILTSAGPNFAFGISNSGSANDSTGTLYAWGQNNAGQLGTGTLPTSTSNPVQVVFPGALGLSIQDVAAGPAHTFAIDSSGALWAWGDNGAGQLGIGQLFDPFSETFDDTVIEEPILVDPDNPAAPTWMDAAAGTNFSIGIRSDGTLWVWGAPPTTSGIPFADYPLLLPVRVGSASNWTAVEAGSRHAVLLNSSGQVFTYGENYLGQLGLGSVNGFPVASVSTPTRVGNASNWVTIGTGAANSYAINSNGELFGWGNNFDTQLAQPASDTSIEGRIIFVPAQIAPGYTFSAVDGGWENESSTTPTAFTITKGVTPGGDTAFLTIGSNNNGQIGNGTALPVTFDTPQVAQADGREITITPPQLDTSTIGVNAPFEVSVTVSNTGAVSVQGELVVELYLTQAPSDDFRESDILSEAQGGAPITLATSPFDPGDEETVTFNLTGFSDSGSFFLTTRVAAPDTPLASSPDETVGTTLITVIQPDLRLSNLTFANGTKIQNGDSFTDVSFTLSNNTIGIVPPSTVENGNPAAVLEVYLLENLSFDPLTDTLPENALVLGPGTTPILNPYTGGLNSVNAPLDPPPVPPISVDFTIDIPVTNIQAGREDYLVVIVVNRESAIAEETGATEDNFLLRTVKIESPNPVAPAFDFGEVQNVGGQGEWREVQDRFAFNDNALESPVIAQGESASFSFTVLGPTTVNAPWFINAGTTDTLSYQLVAANGNDVVFVDPSIAVISGFDPVYIPTLIVIDADNTDLYVPGNYPYPWTITWTYDQVTAITGATARVDLEIPAFIPDTNSLSFSGEPDSSAPVGDSSVKSPAGMTAGQTAALNLTYDLTENSIVKFWWKTTGEAGEDTLTFLVDGVVQSLPTFDFDTTPQSAVISGDTIWQQVAFQVGAGPRSFRWTFSKNSDDAEAQAFLDGLEILQPIPETNVFNRGNPDPSLPGPIVTGVGNPGEWMLVDNFFAPAGQLYEISGLAQGDAVTFTYEVPVELGVNQLPAPWSNSGSDVNGTADIVSFVIRDSNNNLVIANGGGTFTRELAGANSNFVDQLIIIDPASALYQNPGPLPWTIEFTYTKNSANTIDGIAQVGVPPALFSFANVPVSNIDMTIQDVVATPGTYILDDSNGTGVLPITVSMKNVGADFEALPDWDSSNLDIHLSIDQVFGNEDDVPLGTFANQSTPIITGDQIIFQGDIHLPFSTPAGNYFILLRHEGSFAIGDFTLANNSATVGPGFIIVRAPNLVIENTVGFFNDYPYRPTMRSYVKYDITNTGLGTVTESQEFNVQLQLYALIVDLEVLIRTYDDVPQRLFLPEVSAQFPTGSRSSVNHYVDLPTMRDILVALGSIPPGTPEDDASVEANQFGIVGTPFFFRLFVDSTDTILESSETNLFRIGSFDNLAQTDTLFFNIVPVDSRFFSFDETQVTSRTENYGVYVGQPPFSEVTIQPINALSNPILNTDGDAYDNLTEYALASIPTHANLLFDPENQNGLVQLNIPRFPGDPDFLSITFDFNVRMTDADLIVQGADNVNGPWEDIVTIDPPYIDPNGEGSLTGFGGLISNPRVLSVEGNVTDVQDVYSARVTVRDIAPFTGIDSRFMRIVVDTSGNVEPAAPTNLGASLVASGTALKITWRGEAVVVDPNTGELITDGAFHIERSLQPDTGYELIGTSTIVTSDDNNNEASFIDNDVEVNKTYFYRVRTIGTFGATEYAFDTAGNNQFIGVTIVGG
ncbi:MAG: hypothetical protein AAFX93_14875 [Verrucomicrobiota bacterium]